MAEHPVIEAMARALHDSTYSSIEQPYLDDHWEQVKPTFIPDAKAAAKVLLEALVKDTWPGVSLGERVTRFAQDLGIKLEGE